MNAEKIAAIAGTLGLVQGGFRRSDEAHETKLGAMVSKRDKAAASVPVRASLGAMVIGNVRRLLGGRKP